MFDFCFSLNWIYYFIPGTFFEAGLRQDGFTLQRGNPMDGVTWIAHVWMKHAVPVRGKWFYRFRHKMVCKSVSGYNLQ